MLSSSKPAGRRPAVLVLPARRTGGDGPDCRWRASPRQGVDRTYGVMVRFTAELATPETVTTTGWLPADTCTGT